MCKKKKTNKPKTNWILTYPKLFRYFWSPIIFKILIKLYQCVNNNYNEYNNIFGNHFFFFSSSLLLFLIKLDFVVFAISPKLFHSKTKNMIWYSHTTKIKTLKPAKKRRSFQLKKKKTYRVKDTILKIFCILIWGQIIYTNYRIIVYLSIMQMANMLYHFSRLLFVFRYVWIV